MTPRVNKIDEILDQGNRRERKQSLVLGSVLVLAAIGLWFGMRSMTGGGVAFAAPVTGGLGIVLIVRGLTGRN
jgi:hypothetical protein